MILCDAPIIYPSLPEYTPFQQMYMCDPPRIYLSLPEYTPFFKNYNMRRSQILPFLHRIYPPFQQLEYYAPLPESTPPSQIYPPPPINYYMRHSQNLYTLPYGPLFNKCICATLPESIRPSHNIPSFQQLDATLRYSLGSTPG